MLILPNSVFASEAQHQITITYSYVTQNIKESTTVADISKFFRHLPDYYLDIHPGHEQFQVQDSTEVKKDVHIYNKEHSEGQQVEHHYVVTEFKETPNEFFIELYSDHSIVSKGFFKFPCKVMFRFHALYDDAYTATIKASIDIDFLKKRHLFLANSVHTKDIWERHLKQEIDGGMSIIQNLTLNSKGF